MYVEEQLYIEIYFNMYMEFYLDLFSFSLLSLTLSNPGIFFETELSPVGKYALKTWHKKLTMSLRFLPILEKAE